MKWVWSDANTDTHNVVLTNEHPKKVKKSDFRSSSGAVGIKFKRKFKVPGHLRLHLHLPPRRDADEPQGQAALRTR